MRDEIQQKVIAEADYIIATDKRVREVAETFGIGHSTLHRDMRRNLPLLDSAKAEKIDEIFERHKVEGRLLGAHTTKSRRNKKC